MIIIIMGSNLIKSQRWNTFWHDDDIYIDLNNPGYEPVKASFITNGSLSTVPVAASILQSNESITAELTKPSLNGLTDLPSKPLTFVTDSESRTRY